MVFNGEHHYAEVLYFFMVHKGNQRHTLAVTTAYAMIMYRLRVVMSRLSTAAFWLGVREIDDIVHTRWTGDST
jgi:hypothetical protein